MPQTDTFDPETSGVAWDAETSGVPLVQPVETPAPSMNPPRLGAEGGLLAGMVPGQPIPGAETAKSMVLNTVAPTVGQVVGGPAGGAALAMAGNAADQLTRPNHTFKWGELLGAGTLGAVPGGSLAKAGVGGLAKEAAVLGAGGLASKAVQTGIDEQRLPTAGEAASSLAGTGLALGAGKFLDKGLGALAVEAKAAKHAVEDATLREGQAAGYVVPPADINPSAANKIVSSIPGKGAVRQDVVQANQEATTALAAQAIGLNPKQPITQSAINAVRDEMAQPYAKLAAISPKAAQDLEALKQATHDANDLMKKYGRSADPADRKAAEKMFNAADKYEAKLEQHATNAGMPELIPQLNAAKVAIAKTYVVENALNEATGQVSAPKIGALFAKGAPLTGELATIGKFQQAFPRYTGEAEKSAHSGVSKLSLFGGIGAGAAAGGHFFGTPGAIAGGAAGALLPAMEGLPNKTLLSPMWQRNFAQPNYGRVSPDIQAVLARFAAQNAGNQAPQNLNQFIPQ